MPESPICVFCGAPAVEPPRNLSPVADAHGSIITVCTECRTKARRRELVPVLRPARRIVGTRRDPRLAIAEQVEQVYSIEAIRIALESESDPWQFIAILNDRLVNGENTTDPVRDAQQFRQLFFDKLVGLPIDGELHALVGRGQDTFRYDSRVFEREVREARPVEQAAVDDVDPWPDPVDGAAVLDEVHAKLREFLVMLDEEFDGATLWTVDTHCFQYFDFAAYLLLKSPEKRCAKTRCIDVIAPMSNRPLVATHLKPETLFRALQKHHMVPFLDEGHLYIKRSEDHEAVLNGGYQKDKPVWRCVGDSYEPQAFDIYAPKAICTIGDLQDALEDRAIIIHMKRKPRGQHVRPWVRGRQIEQDELRPLRRRLKRWVLDHVEELRNADPEVPAALYANDRAVDIWRPLLAIADVAGGDWPQRARQAAVMLTNRAVESAPETDGTELLRNIRTLFYPVNADGVPEEPKRMITASDLANKLITRAEWLWATYRDGRPLTAHTLGKILKNYHVKPVQKRPRDGSWERRQRGYWREDFDPIFAQYLLPDATDSSSASGRTRETCETPSGGAPQTTENSSILDGGNVSQNGETQGVSDGSAGERRNGHSTGRWTEVDPGIFLERLAASARRRPDREPVG